MDRAILKTSPAAIAIVSAASAMPAAEHGNTLTDNILAEVRSEPNLIGDVFSTAEAPNLVVNLDGTSKFAKVVVVKDNEHVYST